MISASGGVTLHYDPAGRLHQIVGAATTRFLYDGADAIAEYNTSGTVLRRYVHGPGVDEPLVWYEGSGTSDKRYLMADERGSVIGVTDGSGTVTTVNRYDAAGIPGSGNAGLFQYTGQIWLDDVDLYHYKARAYDPKLGRFLQTDPIGTAGGINLHVYVGNDPVNLKDPSGLEECDGTEDFCVRGRRPDDPWTMEYVMLWLNAFDEAMRQAQVQRTVTGTGGSDQAPQGAREATPQACARDVPLGAAKISLGAQLGFSAKLANGLGIEGDINLGSVGQTTGDIFARLEQSFGGGFSMLGIGFGVTSRRSTVWAGSISQSRLSEAPWIGPDPFVGFESLPGVSTGISAPDGDVMFGIGVKAGAGLELQLNSSELGRRLFNSNPCF